MPIFSAASNTQLPDDKRFNPTTEVPRADTPDYAFYFYPGQDYYDKYNFDNCGEFNIRDQSIGFGDIDFAPQDMYYKRLFKLKHLVGAPRYYLCPWLVVPFEDVSGSSTPNYRAQPNNIQLVVTPVSMYDIQASQVMLDRIARNNPDPATPRALELFSSGNGVQAVWDTQNATLIDELAFIKKEKDQYVVRPHTVNVTINDATKYDYTSYIEIRVKVDSTTYVTLGRVYLLFLEFRKRDVLFLEVTQIAGANANTNKSVNIKLLTAQDSQARLTDLNKIFNLSGLRYDVASVTLSLKGGTLAPGNSTNFDTGEIIDPNDMSRCAKITRTFTNNILQINGANWNLSGNTYLIVFLMEFVNTEEIEIVGGVQQTKKTLGDSVPGSRVARVYPYSRKTLCHESGHALGLPHWFFADRDHLTISNLRSNARAAADVLGISSTQELYLFHDKENSVGIEVALSGAPAKFANLVLSWRVEYLTNLFHPRLYAQFGTNNLMDYQSQGKPANQEQLRKHQIEQIRYYA
jgi:hypothetical protein